MSMRPRRPVGVALNNYGGTRVVCDDGSVWLMPIAGVEKDQWVELQPIPGSERATGLPVGWVAYQGD